MNASGPYDGAFLFAVFCVLFVRFLIWLIWEWKEPKQ